MKLYRIWQNENNGWDTYDSAIVCAENEEEAKRIHPRECGEWGSNSWNTWASSPEKVNVEEIGMANPNQKKGVILSSFNAG